jgi:hypothetical protein
VAGRLEIWAARAWNVFNEGRPFSLVFPVLVLGAAAVIGVAPGGSLAVALAGTLAIGSALACFPFPLRGRALLWLAALASVPLLEPWRAPALLAGAVAGYFVFTVLVWGTLYYRLRTGAPWSNGLRFWRLVLTNSDPTSGNALEQVPKLLMALSAGTLLAEEPGVGSALRIATAALAAATLGSVAWRSFAPRLPRYPDAARAGGSSQNGTYFPETSTASRAERVYVIVVDGCNRERLWQADTPTIDRLAREGTEFLAIEPAYPARTAVCFSSMLTGATPAEHGMRSNFAPRLGVRVESIFDVLARRGRRGRLVGIAHLLDPFGEDVVRPVSSVQPTAEIDRSLCAEARRAVEQEDPDLLVLQLLAADQLGHVRGVRSPEYLDQLVETDRRVGDFLAFLDELGKLRGASVILMADHGQGRGIGGHGHLDWGERPIPFVVWGAGAAPGAVDNEPRSVLELATTITALLGVPPPSAARGHPLLPTHVQRLTTTGRPSEETPRERRGPGAGQPPPNGRCLAIVVARDEEAVVGKVLAGVPRTACGLPVDLLLVDDGSRDSTAASGRAQGAEVLSHETSRGLGAALRIGLARARDRNYSAAVYLDGDDEYDPADFGRLLDLVARGRADYVLGSRFLGDRDGMTWHRTLANRAASALLGFLMETVVSDGQTGYRAFSRRALAEARIHHDYNYAQVLTLSLWGAGIDPVEVPIRYRHRTTGKSFVRYPEYLARVAPAVWREWRASRRKRRAIARPMPAASANGQALPRSNNGSASPKGPNGASGRSLTSSPPPARTSR